MLAENPARPTNLVAGGLDQSLVAMNDTAGYYSTGLSGAFTSWDGGRSWLDQAVPANPNWFNVSSPMCKQLHLADTAVAFGPNDTVYYVDLAAPLGKITCTVPITDVGLYGTVSTDGGATWGTPVPIRGTVAGTAVDKPWIAVDQASGEAYVAYTDDGNGSGIYLQNSTDGGRTWSLPVQLTTNGRIGIGVELAVDPWGGVNAAWMEGNTVGLRFSRSMDHGATWTNPVAIATASAVGASSSPDGFSASTFPAIGVDGFTGNAYTGDLFVTWQDGSGGAAGNPSVFLARSGDNGSSWSSPIRVNSDLRPENFQPSVAIGPDGTVYVDWYAVEPVGGHYRLAASLSHDGGRTFDRQINVSDADSNPNNVTTGAYPWIGDYTHMIADQTGARPIWTDARSTLTSPCSGSGCIWGGYVYNISLYTALIVNDSIASTVPVNVTLGGSVPWPGTFGIGADPTAADWLVGQTYNLTAPSSALHNGTSFPFAYWYGSGLGEAALYDNRTSFNGTVVGGERLVACYTFQSGDTCHGAGAPGFLNLTVDPPSGSITINGIPAAAVGGRTSLVEAPGTYWINASAPSYYDFNRTYTVTSGDTTVALVTLTPVTGRIVGSVTPSSALVAINGTGLIVAPNGSFSADVPPGGYIVSASANHFLPYTNTGVQVVSDESTVLAIVLVAFPGWINGTVAPASASVRVNEATVSIGADGSFSARLAPGTYWVNASKSGWSSDSSGPVLLSPFGQASVSLALQEYLGAVGGILVPGNATLLLDGIPLAVHGGSFFANLSPGTYQLGASAWSYAPLSLPIGVAANLTVPLVIVLNLSDGWIVGTVDPASATVRLDGTSIAISHGSFNESASAGDHILVVSSSGFEPLTRSVSVDAGRATHIAMNLSLLPMTSASADPGLSPLLWLGIGAAALGVVAVLLWRRARQRTPPT